jgi:hypothetical protein
MSTGLMKPTSQLLGRTPCKLSSPPRVSAHTLLIVARRKTTSLRREFGIQCDARLQGAGECAQPEIDVQLGLFGLGTDYKIPNTFAVRIKR